MGEGGEESGMAELEEGVGEMVREVVVVVAVVVDV